MTESMTAEQRRVTCEFCGGAELWELVERLRKLVGASNQERLDEAVQRLIDERDELRAEVARRERRE